MDIESKKERHEKREREREREEEIKWEKGTKSWVG